MAPMQEKAPVDLGKMTPREMMILFRKDTTPVSERARLLLAIARAGDKGDCAAIQAQIDLLTDKRLPSIAGECAKYIVNEAMETDRDNGTSTRYSSKLLATPKFIFQLASYTIDNDDILIPATKLLEAICCEYHSLHSKQEIDSIEYNKTSSTLENEIQILYE